MPSPGQALCLDATDGLYEIPDPLNGVIDEHEGDVRAALKAIGFETWTSIGDGAVPLAMRVYARAKGKPRFLVQLEGDYGSFIESVYADDVYAMMRLLGQWTPTVQAAAHVHVASALNLYKDGEPQTPAALLAEAASVGLGKVADKVYDVRRAVTGLNEDLERAVSNLKD
jgi:hypothetical protein